MSSKDKVWAKYYATHPEKSSTIPRSNVQPVDPPTPKIVGQPIRLKSNQEELLILNIKLMNWKGHENYSLEQLMELNETINNYFMIWHHFHKYDIYPLPKSLKKYSVKELKNINQESEKILSKKSSKRKKRAENIERENNIITNPKELKRLKIKKRIEKFVTVNINQIPRSDLIPLENRIEMLKEIIQNPQVSSLDDAILLLLNYELKSYNEKEELTIDDARKAINCYKSKKIIKEKYPEIDLPNNCKDILKMYNEKIVPKDYPNSEFSQEQVDQWNQDMSDKERTSGDRLYENSNKDIK